MSLKSWFERNFVVPDDGWTNIGTIPAAPFVPNPYMRKPSDKPKLATVRNAPSRDEFAAWRQDPTTAFVMAALLRNAVECEDKWFIDSWEAGKADQRTLDGLRERADALRGIAEADYEAFCETLGLEPEPLHGDAA